jgi:chromosome segregation ATPase
MKNVSVYLLSLALGVALISPALAHEADNPYKGKGNTVLATESSRPAAKLANLRQRIASKAADRLQGARLQACERVERNLNSYASKISNALNNHISALNRLQTRIESLAADRQASTKVSNYAALLAAVNSAHEAADASVDDVKDVPEIDCSTENPKGASTEIKDSFKDAKAALKAYHKALRNLLVAVATEGKNNPGATTSATPSATP